MHIVLKLWKATEKDTLDYTIPWSITVTNRDCTMVGNVTSQKKLKQIFLIFCVNHFSIGKLFRNKTSNMKQHIK